MGWSKLGDYSKYPDLDTSHLNERHREMVDSMATYALKRLALWIPLNEEDPKFVNTDTKSLKELTLYKSWEEISKMIIEFDIKWGINTFDKSISNCIKKVSSKDSWIEDKFIMFEQTLGNARQIKELFDVIFKWISALKIEWGLWVKDLKIDVKEDKVNTTTLNSTLVLLNEVVKVITENSEYDISLSSIWWEYWESTRFEQNTLPIVLGDEYWKLHFHLSYNNTENHYDAEIGNKLLYDNIELLYESFWIWLLNVSSEIEKMNSGFYDELTWTKNRKAFNTFWQLCLKEKWTTMLLIDIDDFKNVNTLYWHLWWDEVLIYLWNLLSNAGDLYRLGWDEFWLILRNTDEDWVYNIVRSIQATLKQKRFKTEKDELFWVTLSIWWVMCNWIDKDEISSLLSQADSCWDIVKANWKNWFHLTKYNTNRVKNSPNIEESNFFDSLTWEIKDLTVETLYYNLIDKEKELLASPNWDTIPSNVLYEEALLNLFVKWKISKKSYDTYLKNNPLLLKVNQLNPYYNS